MSLPGALVLLGHPVAHSLSPTFQNAALRAANIPLEYTARDVDADSLGSALESLRSIDAAGNVTVPHKAAVAALCDELTTEARAAMAVNTFRFVDGRLFGHNTDIGGVDAAVREVVGDPRGLQIGVLGAGGSAAAVLEAAKHWDCWITIWARRGEASASLAERHSTFATRAPGLRFAVDAMDLVINTTPVGMRDHGMPVDVEWLAEGAAVLDLVYRPGRTAWVRAARARGHAASDGRTMLLEQGALAFEWWLGPSPDREVMRAALDAALDAP